jgi:pimeloyl-ACP methyl ester carboxylesterase
MKLHYRKTGNGPIDMVILHGLFGSSDNWQTMAKRLAENYTLYLVDFRNHGHSEHTSDISYPLMTEDLAELFADENLREAILVGHSMGGKVAMNFAMKYPMLLSKLVVIDIGVKEYPPHHQKIVEGLTTADLTKLKSRNEVELHLSKYVNDAGVLQFLMKNLYWATRETLGWRINIPVLTIKMNEILCALPSTRVDTETVFIRGQKSDYITDTDIDLLRKQFPNSEFHTIDNAGHWVHAEAPNETFEVLNNL